VGFAGRLSLGSAKLLGFEETIGALERLGVLICWAQAQQARVAARLEELFARDIARAAGREDPGLALSLAAAEAGAVLNLPHMSAMRLVSESSRLGRDHPQTLARLEEGRIGYQHARIILDETQHVPATPVLGPDPDLPVTGADAAGLDAGTGPGRAGIGGDGQPTLLDLLDPDLPGPEGPDGEAGLDRPRPGPDGVDAAGPDAAGEPVNMRQRFEADLLGKAEGRTAAGFGKWARRLRESRFPDTVPVRHRDALERRRVCFEALPDGMSCLTAFLAAEQGQAVYAALSGAAKAGRVAGDPRTVDQLRADALAAVLLDGNHPGDPSSPARPTRLAEPARRKKPAEPAGPTNPAEPAGPTNPAEPADPTNPADPACPAASAGLQDGHGPATPSSIPFQPRPVVPSRANTGRPLEDSPGSSATGGKNGIGGIGGKAATGGKDGGGGKGGIHGNDSHVSEAGGTTPPGRHARRAERHRERTRVKTEVMVLINADTLAGLNDSPAELNGYGPISAEAGRRMILQALSWTPLLQDPASGEILGVGRRRRIPAGLKRWLQARDGTCRFPGCAVDVTRSEIDHTMPWARGGPTEHSNLEHLCPKHHRFKTLGHWKARQPEPGLIEWTSPAGRTYRTNPALDHGAGSDPTSVRTADVLTADAPLASPTVSPPQQQPRMVRPDSQNGPVITGDPPPF